ncbi:hypothetical protein [Azospirillum doebereinerae]
MIRPLPTGLVLLLGWAGMAFAECRTVAVTVQGRPVVGIEDLVVDEALGQAVLSAHDRRAAPEKAGGGLFRIPLAALAGERVEAVELNAGFHPDGGFRPHGMDLRVEADGSRSVLAVNRRWNGDTVVERFSLTDDTLRHRGTVESPLLCRANEVAFLDSGRFLFTGDHGGCGRLAGALEDVLNLRRGFVGLVEEGRALVLATGIGFANGLLPDPAADRLFVAATREDVVLVYRLSALLAGDGTAVPERIAVPGGPDNLSRAVGGALEGRVLAAVHPSLFALALHRFGLPGGATAPTRIVALGPNGVGQDRAGRTGVEVVVEDDGHRLSGATVAAAWRGGLIAGSATSDRLLVCGDGPIGAIRSSGWAAPAAPK